MCGEKTFCIFPKLDTIFCADDLLSIEKFNSR